MSQNLPLWETILYVVQRRVDEDTSIIPRARLNTNSLMNKAMLREIPVRDGNRYIPKSISDQFKSKTGMKITHCVCS
jgi:hypothetical protein